MKKRIVLATPLASLLVSILALAFNVQCVGTAEPPATEWDRTYGDATEDRAHSVAETSDGGYAVAGSGFANLMKTDADGNLLWNKTYCSLDQGCINSVVQTSDGGYALAGYITTHIRYGHRINDFWLVKTDSTGNPEWNKTYGLGDGNFPSDDIAMSMTQTSDGGYAMVGRTMDYCGEIHLFHMVKTDSAGNVQFKRLYHFPGRTREGTAQSVVETADGGYAIAGYEGLLHTREDSNFWLVKTDSAGTMEWNRMYGRTPDDDRAYSIVQTLDGGYAVAGETQSFGAGSSDFWLIKTDSTGNLEWNKTYGETSFESPSSLIQTLDGGYAMAGYTYSFGEGGSDFWLVKTDQVGNMEWNKTCGGTSTDVARFIVQTGDRGYAVAGYTTSPAGDTDFRLLKIVSSLPLGAHPTIDPSILNLNSRGKWTTVFIQLPEGYAPEDIDVSTILVNGTLSPVLDPKYDFVTNSSVYIVDHDGDGIFERMIKFNRTEITSWIYDDLGIHYGEVTLTMAGELYDGTPFEGSGAIRVLLPGDADDDGDVDSSDLYVFSRCHGVNFENPSYNPLADFNEDGYINSEDLLILSENYGKAAV